MSELTDILEYAQLSLEELDEKISSGEKAIEKINKEICEDINDRRARKELNSDILGIARYQGRAIQTIKDALELYRAARNLKKVVKE